MGKRGWGGSGEGKGWGMMREIKVIVHEFLQVQSKYHIISCSKIKDLMRENVFIYYKIKMMMTRIIKKKSRIIKKEKDSKN